MKLSESTWYEVEAYLRTSRGIILPVGSTEQHGPVGLIGTDAICAEQIAWGVKGALVAPTLAYTPAPFNTGFPGTISLSGDLFQAMAKEILTGLQGQGFKRIYILNGHGANLEPLRAAIATLPKGSVHLRSWWDFEAVNGLRREFYGDWEGMHATPSEVAITQATHRTVLHPAADHPPRKLSAEFIKAHAGDKHGPAQEHRKDFPDGRVGSHSALATPAHGQALLDAAIKAVSMDYHDFTSSWS